jgi:hypothetical protein
MAPNTAKNDFIYTSPPINNRDLFAKEKGEDQIPPNISFSSSIIPDASIPHPSMLTAKIDLIFVIIFSSLSRTE